MKIIENFKEIDRREILDCRIKSLRELAKYYGVQLNSFQVMMLAESVSFHYGRLSIEGIAFQNVPFATASNYTIEDSFFDSLNINYVKEEIGGDVDGIEKLKGLVDRDIPVLFRLDSRALKHGGTIPSENKINVHYLSTLLLVGYDENDFYVVLTNTDEQKVPVAFAINTIQTYRNDECIPYSPKGECFYLDRADEMAAAGEHLDSAVYRGMLNISNVMLNLQEAVPAKFERSRFEDMCSGIEGMCKLRKDIREILLDSAFSKKQVLHDQLSLLFIRNNLMFGSYSGFREEFYRGLSSLGELMDNQKLVQISKLAEEDGKLWKKFLMLVNKAGRKNHLLRNTFLAYICWGKIIRKEKRFFHMLREECLCKLENGNE